MGRGAQGEQDEEWVEEEGMEIEAEIEEGEGASVSGLAGLQLSGATSLDVDQDAFLEAVEVAFAKPLRGDFLGDADRELRVVLFLAYRKLRRARG